MKADAEPSALRRELLTTPALSHAHRSSLTVTERLVDRRCVRGSWRSLFRSAQARVEGAGQQWRGAKVGEMQQRRRRQTRREGGAAQHKRQGREGRE
jgi:hypothetical protein